MVDAPGRHTVKVAVGRLHQTLFRSSQAGAIKVRDHAVGVTRGTDPEVDGECGWADRGPVEVPVAAQHEASPRVAAIVAGNIAAEIVYFLKLLASLTDFVDDSTRSLRDKTAIECCAVKVSVRTLDESAIGIAPLPVSRAGSAAHESMEQRELALRGNFENRAVTALQAALAVIAAVKSRAIEVAVGRLHERRVR